MKTALFLGVCDKSDLLLYLCKLIAATNQKVLLVDTTQNQVYNNFVPSVTYFPNYGEVVDFCGLHIAKGIRTYQGLQTYATEKNMDISSYDLMLIDVDSLGTLRNWPDANYRVLVTNFEKPTTEGNMLLIADYFGDKKESVGFMKVIYSVDCNIKEEYINSLLQFYPITWMDESFLLPHDEVDYAVKIENQYDSRLNVKRLSKEFKNTLVGLAQNITGLQEKQVKTALKLIERGK